MARLLFTAAIKRACPPWLQRYVGGRVMESLASPIDELVDRLVDGAKARFPGHDPESIDPGSLAAIGRERRIRRGPGESSATYARRLLTWWDDHRTRGGPYALLRQIHAYFLDTLPTRVDVVYQSGTRRWKDEDGEITRDEISWNGDGSGEWAHVWVFFYLPDASPDLFTTDDGDQIVTDDGDALIFADGVEIPSDDDFLAIPREWSAAHIPYITVVLLSGTPRLWGYPQPVPTWGTRGPWQSTNPTVLIAE
jgi:hypothetical protein